MIPTKILPNGTSLPLIGLGTRQMDEPLKLKQAMEEALHNGYRHFDTSPSFKNENIVGKVIQRWISRNTVKRRDLFITSKLPMEAVHPKRVATFLNRSLRNLEVDYVDLYLIEFPVCVKANDKGEFAVNELGEIQTEKTDLIEVWKEMEKQVMDGKTDAIGLSNFSKTQMEEILKEAVIKPAVLQIESHVYLQNGDLIEFCEQNGVSVIAHSPLGSPDLMLEKTVVKIAGKYGKTPAQILLRFLVQSGVAAVPKSTQRDRIKENVQIFNFDLDTNDLDALKKLDKGEAGRIRDFKNFKGLSDHPEFPFQVDK